MVQHLKAGLQHCKCALNIFQIEILLSGGAITDINLLLTDMISKKK